jgi:hypothetical protein
MFSLFHLLFTLLEDDLGLTVGVVTKTAGAD